MSDLRWVEMDAADIIATCDRSFRECAQCYRERPTWWMEATLDVSFADDVREEMRRAAGAGGQRGGDPAAAAAAVGLPPAASRVAAESNSARPGVASLRNGVTMGGGEMSTAPPKGSPLAFHQDNNTSTAPGTVSGEDRTADSPENEQGDVPLRRGSMDSTKSSTSSKSGPSGSFVIPPTLPPGTNRLQQEAKKRLLRNRMSLALKEHETNGAKSGGNFKSHEDMVVAARAAAAAAVELKKKKKAAAAAGAAGAAEKAGPSERAVVSEAGARASPAGATQRSAKAANLGQEAADIPAAGQISADELRARARLLMQMQNQNSSAQEHRPGMNSPHTKGISNNAMGAGADFAVPGMAASVALEAQMAAEQLSLEELKARASELLQQRDMLRMRQLQQRQIMEETILQARQQQQHAAELRNNATRRRVSEILASGDAAASINPSMLNFVLSVQQQQAASLRQAEIFAAQNKGMPSSPKRRAREERPLPDEALAPDGESEASGNADAETAHRSKRRCGPRRVSVHAEDNPPPKAGATTNEEKKQSDASAGTFLFSSSEERQLPRCLANRGDRLGSLTKKADPAHVMREGVTGQFDDCDEDEEDPVQHSSVQPPTPLTASKQAHAGNDLLDVIGGMMMMKNQN